MAHREVEVAARVTARVLVGARREEEVALEGAQLDAVRLALVHHHEGVPARGRIHAPADVAHAVRLLLVEGGEVRAQQIGVEVVAVDRRDAIARDRQAHRLAQVVLEGQVRIARREHERALDRTRGGKRDHESAGPVRDRARTIRGAPRPGGEGTGEADPQIGADRRGDVHLLGRAQALQPRQHARLELAVVRRPALERLGILVGDHQHAGTGAEDGGQLGRVQQPLDRAVEDEVGGAQRGDGGRVALQRDARAGRADRDRSRIRRRRHAHVEHATAEILRGQPRRVDERAPAAGLAEHGDDLTGREPARRERTPEDVEGAVLHQALSTMAIWSRSSRLSASGASSGV